MTNEPDSRRISSGGLPSSAAQAASPTDLADSELELSVPDWLIEHPEALRRLEELGIDYHCGGKSLATACRERGLDPQQTLIDLKSAPRKESF
jgi:regulator of cell morphogenesis and NO signaling